MKCAERFTHTYMSVCTVHCKNCFIEYCNMGRRMKCASYVSSLININYKKTAKQNEKRFESIHIHIK